MKLNRWPKGPTTRDDLALALFFRVTRRRRLFEVTCARQQARRLRHARHLRALAEVWDRAQFMRGSLDRHNDDTQRVLQERSSHAAQYGNALDALRAQERRLLHSLEGRTAP